MVNLQVLSHSTRNTQEQTRGSGNDRNESQYSPFHGPTSELAFFNPRTAARDLPSRSRIAPHVFMRPQYITEFTAGHTRRRDRRQPYSRKRRQPNRPTDGRIIHASSSDNIPHKKVDTLTVVSQDSSLHPPELAAKPSSSRPPPTRLLTGSRIGPQSYFAQTKA